MKIQEFLKNYWIIIVLLCTVITLSIVLANKVSECNKSSINISGATAPKPSNIHALVLGPNAGAFKKLLQIEGVYNPTPTSTSPNYTTIYSKIEDLDTKYNSLKNALIYIYYSNNNYSSSLEGQTSLYKIFNLLSTKFKTEGLVNQKETNVYGNRVMLIVDILDPTRNYVDLFNGTTKTKYAPAPSTRLKNITVPTFPVTNNGQTSLTYLLNSGQSGWAGAGEKPIAVTDVGTPAGKKSIWGFSDYLMRTSANMLRRYDMSIVGLTNSFGAMCSQPLQDGTYICKIKRFTNYPSVQNQQKLPPVPYDLNFIKNIRTLRKV